jgi:hypothetical protein
MPFLAAYGFMVLAALSPLSVYTSMFLPESMYLFLMGILLLSVLGAMKVNSAKSWLVVGAVLGIASLVKPHAWLSSIAVVITIMVVSFGTDKLRLKSTTVNALSLAAGAVVSRIVVGVAVAGPKALGFFGQYLGQSTFEQVVRGPEVSPDGSIVGSSPINGVFGLFFIQLNIHLLVMSALMAIFVVGVTLSVGTMFSKRKLDDGSNLILFAFIWFFTLLLEVVIFTGWVTGGGDDHTTRVLLRYYEYLFLILPLAGLVALIRQAKEKPNAFFRWALVIGLSILLTQAFSGFFARLTIQIADAPTLAGLVVNMDLFNLIAILSITSILVLATFPRYSVFAAACLLPFTFVGLGWQIQDQYQIFRAVEIPADSAGKYLATNFAENVRDESLVIATSRFDATLAALWADSGKITYEQFNPGSQVDAAGIFNQYSHVVVIGDISLLNAPNPSHEGKGFLIFSRE